MGASDRDRRRQRPRPRLVMYDWDVWIGGYATKRDPYPAILVDRRKITIDGRPDRWEGLVVYATGGGDMDWKVEFRWVDFRRLKPLD